MIDFNQLDDLARRLSDLVPPGLRQSREELQSTFKGALQAGLGKLDLVTREEFDVQRAVLLRTRENSMRWSRPSPHWRRARPARRPLHRLPLPKRRPPTMSLALVHSRARVGCTRPKFGWKCISGGLPPPRWWACPKRQCANRANAYVPRCFARSSNSRTAHYHQSGAGRSA